MKVKPGRELYQADSSSFIAKSNKHWWHELDPRIRQEPIEIAHRSFGHRFLGKILSLLDWIPLLALLVLPHYYIVGRNRNKYLADRSQWGFYQSLAEQHNAELIFKMPVSPDVAQVKTKIQRHLGEGKVISLTMPSTFEPINPHYKDSYWQHHKHQNVVAQLSVHDGEPRPTVIAIHGYDTEMYGINKGIFSTKDLYHQGCNICLLKLPFHRSKIKSFAETTNIFSRGPAYTNEVFAHAVYDCRMLISYLLDQGIASKISITGISLGAFVSSLVASSESRLHSAILIDPVYNLSDTLMEWFLLRGLLKQIKQEENLSDEEFRRAYACCNALTFKPAIATDRLMIIASLYDLIAIPRYARLLGEHWDNCQLVWKNYSHVGMPRVRPFYKEMMEHLQSTQFFD